MSRASHATGEGRAYLQLRSLAKANGRATSEYLQLFALEGFAGRLSKSGHKDRLVLKGGLLMSAFNQRRPTRDVDLLALGMDSDEETIREVVREILSVGVDDGLDFSGAELRSRGIREGGLYAGIRVSVEARLATAKLSFHVDVNVGDPVVPGPELTQLPRLLGGEPILLLGYPPEMVVAEKLVTAFERGGANTRWRDFADIFLLVEDPALNAKNAAAAIRRVAIHRGVDLEPFARVRNSLEGHGAQKWQAWRRKQRLESRVPGELADVLAAIEAAVEPLIAAALEIEGA